MLHTLDSIEHVIKNAKKYLHINSGRIVSQPLRDYGKCNTCRTTRVYLYNKEVTKITGLGCPNCVG
tara:strand:- start:1138 stop:1335 length:198 start_codon:yes stop_codon:yes gene_type:complete